MPHSLFISDLHLSRAQPRSMAEFLHFAAEFAAKAEALYILGDLFEYWAGDDDLDDAFHAQVIATLAGLARHHTQVYLLRGNRDLLMGETLANACHAKLLDDPTLMICMLRRCSSRRPLCTDDVDFCTIASQCVRIQKTFSPDREARKAFIEQLRQRSTAAKQNKDSAIMDANDAAVAALLRAYHYPRLIHGHTHLPGRHEHAVDGHTCERWVLGDWDQHGSALRVDALGCNVILFSSIPQPAQPFVRF